MYQQDWLMRQIEQMVVLIARLLFGKDTARYELRDAVACTPADILHTRLLGLLADGRLNQAENILYENIDPGNADLLAVALDFYARLNALGDPALEAADFSRAEVESGLREITRRYGLDL